jgi:hypothetical protein
METGDDGRRARAMAVSEIDPITVGMPIASLTPLWRELVTRAPNSCATNASNHPRWMTPRHPEAPDAHHTMCALP